MAGVEGADPLAVSLGPPDAELREGLERALAGVGMAAPSRIARRPSDYRTSFPLEELEVGLVDGSSLRLAFKQLDWARLDAGGRLAKPTFLHDPGREPAVYASLLSGSVPGPPRYCGALVEADAGRHWLFVEWVEGRELYQVGELELWAAAARWLGELHARFRGEAGPDGALPLVECDQAYYRCWLDRARGFAEGEPDRARLLEWLAERYDAVVEELLSLPQTLLHGEFYASNVLVAEGRRVAPVDWELAARGPGVVDLAALVSGGWDESERARLVAAYREGAGRDSFSSRHLDLARLHLAVQWLGWAPPGWAPPEGQRHDWLAEANELAERLEL